MYFVPNVGTFLSKLKTVSHDDLVDRLNYYITPIILLTFMLTIGAKQFLGSPIQCWVPAQWKGGWEQYAEDYCFIQNTYSVPFEEDLPEDISERGEREIGYYQWVPLVLGLMTALFYVPQFIWRTFSWQSGINIDELVKKAKAVKSEKGKNKKAALSDLADEVENALGTNSTERWTRGKFSSLNNTTGCYVSILYLFVKVLFVANAFVQFITLNNFLDTNHWWGMEMMTSLMKGNEWVDAKAFPRVTMCDVTVRVLGQTHRNTIQCVLMINMFNEKIFLFLWFWILGTGLITACNFGFWLVTSLPMIQSMTINRAITRAHCTAASHSRDHHHDGDSTTSSAIAPIRVNRRQVDKFARNELRSDGVLIMRFIESHAGEMVVAQLCYELFRRYLAKPDETPTGSETGLLGAEHRTSKSSMRYPRNRSRIPHDTQAFEYEEHLYNEKDTLPRTNETSAAGYPGPPAASAPIMIDSTP